MFHHQNCIRINTRRRRAKQIEATGIAIIVSNNKHKIDVYIVRANESGASPDQQLQVESIKRRTNQKYIQNSIEENILFYCWL